MKTHKKLISRTTNITLIIGLFFSGGLLAGLLGIQMLICHFGVDCVMAWKILWGITGASCFILPVIFRGYIKRNYMKFGEYKFRLRLNYATVLFNLLEIACIQLGVGLFFTDPESLCYARDGQVGLELIFAGMVAVPILMILGFVFQRFLNRLIDGQINIL